MHDWKARHPTSTWYYCIFRGEVITNCSINQDEQSFTCTSCISAGVVRSSCPAAVAKLDTKNEGTLHLNVRSSRGVLCPAQGVAIHHPPYFQGGMALDVNVDVHINQVILVSAYLAPVIAG